MKQITHKHDIAKTLQEFDVEDSVALCVFNGLLDASFVLAARQAGYLCDRLVVLNLATPLNETQKNILRRVNVDALFEPEVGAFKLTEYFKSNMQMLPAILSSLMGFMPLVVGVPQNQIELIRLMKNIQNDFGDAFELVVKSTPPDLLNTQQKTLRKAMLPCLENIQNGEADVDTLKSILQNSFKEYDLTYVNTSFYDGDTFEECYGIVSPTCYVSVECTYAGQKVYDIFTISDI